MLVRADGQLKENRTRSSTLFREIRSLTESMPNPLTALLSFNPRECRPRLPRLNSWACSISATALRLSGKARAEEVRGESGAITLNTGALIL